MHSLDDFSDCLILFVKFYYILFFLGLVIFDMNAIIILLGVVNNFSPVSTVTIMFRLVTMVFSPVFSCYPLLPEGSSCARTTHHICTLEK